MSEYHVKGIKGLVSDVSVYDISESVRASKYPMNVDISVPTSFITKMTKALASAKIGEGHDNFLNGVRVAFDLTVTNKMWVEVERYHFFDFVSSQSTMHCITKFSIPERCDRHVDMRVIDVLQEKVDLYNRLVEEEVAQDVLAEAYLNVLMNVPSGFKLTARMTTNYRQLKTVWVQRHNHRLPEWREFCKWMVDYLPFFDLCLGEVNPNDEGSSN